MLLGNGLGIAATLLVDLVMPVAVGRYAASGSLVEAFRLGAVRPPVLPCPVDTCRHHLDASLYRLV